MLLMPLSPHLAHECCEKINKKFYWPKYNSKFLKEEKCSIVIQVDGRKRGILNMQLDVDENLVIKEAKKIENVNKNIENKVIIRSIFLKNKLINFITKK